MLTHTIDGIEVPLRLHQETFAQALGIPSEYKYEKPGLDYLKKVFTLIKSVSSSPLEDLKKACSRLRYCKHRYLRGNLKRHAMQIFDRMKNDIKPLLKETSRELADQGFVQSVEISGRIQKSGGLNAKN